MTRSTGARAARKRREELFGAQLTLRRVLLHMAGSLASGCCKTCARERKARRDAFRLVRAAYWDIVAEQKDLT